MTPQAAAALRCPVCGGALMPLGTSLRCPQGHSYDMAKEGYVNLLAIQKRHAADPGDGKAMVRARRAFLQAGYYAPFQKALAELCLEYAPECGETHLLDAGLRQKVAVPRQVGPKFGVFTFRAAWAVRAMKHGQTLLCFALGLSCVPAA